jgi:hypothetical protein
MAVGEHWFETHDPMAYRLAERLFEVRREVERKRERGDGSLNAPQDVEPTTRGRVKNTSSRMG